MTIRQTLPVFLILSSLASAAGAQEDAKTLTAELLVDLKTVAALDLSPDGTRVAYALEVPRAKSDPPGRSYQELWVANLEKGKTRRFTSDKERITDPAFTPDGKSITFLVEREVVQEHTQIYSIRLRGGEARLLTKHESSVEAYAWSPDGRHIAFTAEDPETEQEKEDEDAGRDWKDADQNPKFTRLYLFDVKKKTSRLAFEDDLQISDFLWHPDGERLVVRAAPSPRIDDDYMLTQFYTVAADDGEASPTQIATTPGKLGTMDISPDGRHLAFLGAVSTNDPLAQSLFVMELDDGAEPHNLTEGFEGRVYEGSGADLAWWDDDTVFLVAVEGSRHAVYQVDATSGERRRFEWPSLVVHDFEVQPGNDRLVVAADAADHPTDLYAGRANGADLALVDSHNPELEDVRLARQEVIEWTGPEDWRIEGVLTYPLDYQEGQRYPLVLQVHGGPEGVSLDGWRTSPGYPVQLLAKDGFMVLEPNYRGSQGRGVAFSKADHDDLGGLEYDDVLAGVDALVERGLVDGERVGTGGWSYGGYFSAWGATRHSERFKAAVMAAGISNWVSFTGTTDIPNEMSLVHWNSWWFDEPELHWERSPLAHINKAQTPVLILHGEKDDRVHPEQGMELYTALRIKEVPTRFVVYPREPHGLRERAHELDAIERIRGWFETYLQVPTIEAVKKPAD